MKLDRQLVLEYGGLAIADLKSEKGSSVTPAVDGPSRQAVILKLLDATHEQVMQEFSRLLTDTGTTSH